jgi:hypothetical protein
MIMQQLTKTSRKKSASEAVNIARGFKNPTRVQSSAKALYQSDAGFMKDGAHADWGFRKYACKTIQTSRGGISFLMNRTSVFDLEGGGRYSTQRWNLDNPFVGELTLISLPHMVLAFRPPS